MKKTMITVDSILKTTRISFVCFPSLPQKFKPKRNKIQENGLSIDRFIKAEFIKKLSKNKKFCLLFLFKY